MNFIDRALENKSNMSADDLLQEMANIYQESGVWEKLKEYPQFIRDIIYIIDYDTELQMRGLDGYINGLCKERYEETKLALINCGAITESQLLEQVGIINPDDPKWLEQCQNLEKKVALNNDYSKFWKLVLAYIEKMK